MASGCGHAPAVHGGDRVVAPTVILVSFDGLRWDYPELHGAPTMQRLARNGVRAEGLIPVFPTVTFPNHYTTVTGLYPEQHGIVGNTMYDPEWDAVFSLGDRAAVEDGRWWGGEPIWVTAERQGLISGCSFWPGSEAPVAGVRPTYWRRFDAARPNEERVDEVLGWLDLPAESRPQMITLYFGEVDHYGHTYGPTSDETRAAVQRNDGYLKRLVDGLDARGLLDRVHLILTSDHGMAQMDPERTLVLEDFIDLDDVDVVSVSSTVMLRPKAGREDAVFEALDGAHPHLHVYRKSEVPHRLHYRNHRRITPIVGWLDEGWFAYPTEADRQAGLDAFPYGMHGFDNRLESMRGLFIAHGPAFRRGLEIPAISSIQLYNLMAAVLEIEPAPNEGDPGVIAPLLNG